MNQKPSQLRSTLSRSHVVTSRISRRRPVPCTVMSAIHFNSASAFHAKVRLMRPRFFLHPESWAQRSTNVLRCAETHASLAIAALELPLGHRDRALHVFTARAVVS